MNRSEGSFLRLARLAGVLCLSLASALSFAASVDLASAPMVSGLSRVVPPNVYFILDDSGSMASDYMPDGVTNDSVKPCYKNYGYNSIYFNPNANYVVPVKADGSSYTASSFTAAKTDGFTSASTVNLSTSFVAGTTSSSSSSTTTTNSTTTASGDTRSSASYSGATKTTSGSTDTYTFPASSPSSTTSGNTITTVTTQRIVTVAYSSSRNRTTTTDSTKTSSTVASGDPAQAAYYYVYTAAPTSPPTTCAADTAYTKVAVSAAQQQNFANWYTYYRTRIQMVKSAAGRAFSAIGSSYRVGFSTISETGTGSTKFLNISTFNSTQKSSWYSKLYAATPANSTPLRGALSKAGRLYAGKLVTGNSDPVIYSCQQNFTILTTDGYWNTSDESSTYTANREDNATLVGDQDGVTGTARPYLDSGKYTNTLADVAMYYYKTDLRPVSGLGGLTPDGTRVDVSSNNVPTSSGDSANWQHMVTYTMGLGVSGVLKYDENYLSGGSSDYTAILQGTLNWPNPQTSSSSMTVTERIDDLWHAAVNGHGQYLSAGNPDSVVSALNKALAAISKTTGSAAAAATSSLEPVTGNNYAYVAQYTTALWTGDLQARSIDLVTGAVSATPVWSARDLLESRVSTVSDTRTIYTYSSSASIRLKTFTSANLSAEKSARYFRSDSNNPQGALTQSVFWSTDQQDAASDDAMIAYLRGQTAYEDRSGAIQRLFRDRTYTLGDIVNGAPVFVKVPPFKYADSGYAAFVAANAGRAGTVYVGANDGMLHAFNADTGAERWAYIPSAVIPNLYKLADSAYANNHRFYVDGTITVGDVYDGSKWITMLVGGLGGGGRAFYALDITDPANPKALWEYGTTQDADMGYSYGNPIITKRASDGRWVVLFASGYNNTLGDSRGRLYVVDAVTGARLSEIVTDSTVVDPNVSGIARITNFVVDTLTDNSTQYVYGGDLGGALWRFDLTAGTSQKLGSTSALAGNQPITIKPEVARVRDTAGNYQRVVYFATGRYLGFGDLSSTSTSATVAQGVYAVKDTGTNLGVFSNTLVQQTLNTATSPRTIPNPQTVDWAVKNGWYMLLPVGERINVDLKLQLGTLVLISNVPKDDYCVVGGSSWLYALNYQNGAAVTGQTGGSMGLSVGSSIGTGLTLVRLPSGKLVAIVTEADTTLAAQSVAVDPTSGMSLRRVAWREIY